MGSTAVLWVADMTGKAPCQLGQTGRRRAPHIETETYTQCKYSTIHSQVHCFSGRLRISRADILQGHWAAPGQHGYSQARLKDKVKRLYAPFVPRSPAPQAQATTGRIGSWQQLAGGVPWGCSGGAQRPCGDHLHPIQLRFHKKKTLF